MTTFYNYPRFNKPKADVFKSATNNYAYPERNACSGVADTTYLGFFPKENIGLIRGNTILSKINFKDFRLEVDSWNQETKIFEPGEISYIAGLTKGLMREAHVFPFLDFNSLDVNKNRYFMKIDALISYYRNFTSYNKVLSASSDYSNSLDIANALNLELSDLNSPIGAAYDTDSISFTGNNEGFKFDIRNVQLTLIDSSVNPNSPFDASIVNGKRVPRTYTLNEDLDQYIPSAKYPNGAFRGIVMKIEYPEDYYNEELMDPDKYVFVHHIHNDVTYYDSSILSLTKDVSVNYVVTRDSSIYSYIGVTKPYIDLSFNVTDNSCNIDTSAGPYPDTSTYDSSTYGIFYNNTLYDKNIDTSILSNYNILDSSANDASIDYSYIFGGNYEDSSLGEMIIEDASLSIGYLIDGSIFNSNIFYNVVKNNYIYNTYSDNLTSSGGNIFDNSTIENGNLNQDTLLCSDNINTNISNSNIARGTTSGSELTDVSIYSTILINTTLLGNNTYIDDASLSSIDSSGVHITNSLIEDASVNDTYIIGDSIIRKGYFIDSSIQQSFIEEDVSIYDSFVNNSWINKNINDISLKGELYSTGIWDSSVNIVNIYDSSIYNCIIYDSSLFNCTLINSNLINTYKDSSTKNIMLDPSIVVQYDTISDPSTYYIKKTKSLRLGEIESTDKTIGAKDYLTFVNNNDEWTKIGKLYSRITSTEHPLVGESTLANGMYVYNPHDFKVRVNYILIE